MFDAGSALAVVLGGRSYCELYTRPDSCGGHFSSLGSGLLAEAAAAELRRRGLVK